MVKVLNDIPQIESGKEKPPILTLKDLNSLRAEIQKKRESGLGWGEEIL